MPSVFIISGRTLVLIFLASAGWAFSFGLSAPLTSLWLQDAGISRSMPGIEAALSWVKLGTLIGLNSSIYYFGIVLAAVTVPWVMRRWGRGTVVAGMILSGLTVACLPWTGHLAFWLACRFLNGTAASMTLISLETFVNRHSAAENRARNFGIYAFAIALGWALGNLIGLEMYVVLPRLALALGGIITCLSTIWLVGFPAWPAEPADLHHGSSPRLLRRHFLSYGSAWSQGFLEGGMVAFLAVYLVYLGMSENRVAWLTSGIMIGVIVFQIPVAWLADRLGRTRVLIGCYAAAALGLAFLPGCGDSVWLALGLFLVGACSGAFYPLGLAILGEQLAPSHLARANAWYLAINCIGSVVGPTATGWVMDQFGKPAMFLAGEAAVAGVLMVWLARRWLFPRADNPAVVRCDLAPIGDRGQAA
jgi:MFS family permease